MSTELGAGDVATPVRAGALVVCDAVSRTFGRGGVAVSAVREVSCTVSWGMQVALTGPSGSGKSTLLHLLAGLDAPTSGAISWPGLDGIRNSGSRSVGVVFQGPSLIPALDVLENVTLPLLLHGAGEAGSVERARGSLDRLQIGDLARKLPDELSGGQAQRVAIARVLAARPPLILADEPTGQLDHGTGDRVLSVLLDAAEELGAALVVSTHDPRVAQRLLEHWSMVDGRLSTDATS